jgi:hypothetical protein
MEFSNLVGKTIFKWSINKENDVLNLYCTDGKLYSLKHDQDCCETVGIEDINGDLNDLLETPILMADEVSNKDETGHYESATWTFYKLATIKGYITIRWLGTSNGYYSESVYLSQSDIDPSELRDFKLNKLI